MTAIERREADQIEGAPSPETQNLVGHASIFAALVDTARVGRMPSALLLHGPRGIGKATLAFALARHLLESTSDEPAERIRAQIAQLSHPNVFVLRRRTDPKDAAKFYSVIRVDDVRETRDALQQTRGRAGYRVCIIDSIDDCNANSANALLKTLEEPPAETVFIVLSHRPGGLLPTIRSRCRAMAMRGLEPDAVRTVLSALHPDIDADTLERATIYAAGRPRRGLELLMMADGDVLDALSVWLQDPARHPSRAYLSIADALAGGKGAELTFAQDLIREWLAEEAKQAARAGQRFRLASANDLWDKASALFTDAEIYNLDRRQTLVSVFDAIRDHTRKTVALTSGAQ